LKELILTDAKIAAYDPAEVGFKWLDPGMLHIKNGQIAAIAPGVANTDALSQHAEIISLDGKVVIPAFVNGHTHLSQTFMRGLAAGRPLLQWLKELIWPLQAAFSSELIELAALLGLAENTRSGAAHVVDHHKITTDWAFTRAVMRAAQQSGLRVTIARAWVDLGANAESPEAILSELKDGYAETAQDQKVAFASGPLTTWRCSAEMLQKTHQLALENHSFSHIHLSETKDEVQMTLNATGLRPVAWLDNLAILDNHFQIVHAVWVDPDEIELLAEKQSPVIHCPVSNAVLGSGIAPVNSMLAQGVKVHLGTDGPASNDTQDCVENMKIGLCIARAAHQNADAITPYQALRMATTSPGLAVGQPADLAMIQLESVWASPIHDIESALVLSSRVADIQSLMVGGEFVMVDSQLTKIDEDILLKEAQNAIKILRKKAGLDQ
jgi:5-methylthioadenosine/S-adenosylhomocysteine deaminase